MERRQKLGGPTGENHREVAVETLTERPASQRGWESSSLRSVASHSASLPRPLVRLHSPTHPPSLSTPPSVSCCDRPLYFAAEICYYFYPPLPPFDCHPFKTSLSPFSRPSLHACQRLPILLCCKQSTHSKQVSIIRAKQTIRHEPSIHNIFFPDNSYGATKNVESSAKPTAQRRRR